MQQSYATEDRVGFQHDWVCNVFVVIDDEANDKDAAAGLLADTVPDDADDWMCRVSGDDDWWCDLRDLQGDEDVERRRRMYWKARKRNMIVILLMYERAIWLLSYWYTKEQYDC